MIYLQEARYIHWIKERYLGLFPTLENFMKKIPIALLVLADRKDMFDNYSACAVEAVRVLACLESDGFKEVYDS